MTKKLHRESLIVAVILLILLGACIYLDSILPSYHIVIKVIKKAAVYSLVAVSMNLLNGFTGLFSLGQAGFMLLGAYAYAVLCIRSPSARASISSLRADSSSSPCRRRSRISSARARAPSSASSSPCSSAA